MSLSGREWAILTGQPQNNALGTPEEFEAWLATDQTIPLQEWLTNNRQVQRSDDLAEALDMYKSYELAQSITNPKTTRNMDVFRFEGDRRVVIGKAKVETAAEGHLHVTFELNSDSISKHYGILGPFSIGEAW